MAQSIEQSQEASPASEGKPSFGHLLLVWFLVGSSFWTLGLALFDAVPAVIPLSRLGAGLLFGTAVIVLLWSLGWHPSLPASAGYFVSEAAFSVLLLSGITLVFSLELTPWGEVGLHTTAIVLAAALIFTDCGRQIRNWIRQHIWTLLKLPSEDSTHSHE
ncbi:hypothetical protein BV210_06580 [Halorientalis sp. IM1011]|uniref:hypothetical protein n=1 Tax=Halorientalis sp. IM1011 TaxID=1932360 RepID=UPI00097CD73F|nr:hypothetical protein [Halorientalis sp. IM1011]AQL42399.1 hypothetical protein BV210_06580 [Halorientalis sp. IM1011]